MNLKIKHSGKDIVFAIKNKHNTMPVRFYLYPMPNKKGTKNQKPFLKMYIMQLDNIKMTVGLQKVHFVYEFVY